MKKITHSDVPQKRSKQERRGKKSSHGREGYMLYLLQMTAFWLYVAVVPLSSCTHVGGKNNDETLTRVSELTRQADALKRSNTDSAIYLMRRAIDVVQSVHNDSLYADLLIGLGYAYSIKNDLEHSDSCYSAAEEQAANFPNLLANLFIGQGINRDKRGDAESALALYNRAYAQVVQSVPPDENMLQRIDQNRSASYQKRAQYDSAMICLQRAMRAAEKMGNQNAVANIWMSMGNVRFRMRDYEEADSLFQLAEKNYAAFNDVRMLINVKSNRIIAMKNLGFYDEALVISFESERLADSIGALNLLGAIYNNRGSIYFDQKDYPHSLEMAHRSLELKEQLGDTAGLIASLNSVASIHIEMKDYVAAFLECQKALQLSEEKHLATYLQDIYENLSIAYSRSGDFETALAYLKKRDVLRDSVFTREKYAVIEEMKTRYETEMREQTLHTAMLQLNKNRQGVFALALLSVLLSLACVYVYITQRRKLQQYVLIAKQGEKVAELTTQTLSPQCRSDDAERRAVGLSEEKSTALLRALRDCMEERMLYKDPSLTLDTLAETIGTNRSYLSILINSRMKKGFTEYVNFYRVREGKRLLKETNYKITVISQEVGYGSPQSFYTAFRNATQLTPAQYRKAARTENAPKEEAKSER